MAPDLQSKSSSRWKRNPHWTLLSVVLVGALIRWAGMHWGLPAETHQFSFHPDETRNMTVARRMLETGDLNPHFFNYGSLYSYLVWACYVPLDWLGLLNSDRDFLMAARCVTLCCGLLTIVVLYAIGKNLLGFRLGLMAALLLALTPGHAMHSSFATVDVPATLFASLSFLGALRFHSTGSRKYLMLSALACGLAAATKYPVGICGLSTFAALALRVRSDSNTNRPGLGRPGPARGLSTGQFAGGLLSGGLTVGMVAGLGFLFGTPYAVLDFGKFWADARFELLQHPFEGHGPMFDTTGSGWWALLTSQLPYLLGPVLLWMGLFGFVSVLRNHKLEACVLLATAIPLMVLLSLNQVKFMRYSMTLAPLLCIGAAAIWIGVWESGKKGRILGAGLLIAIGFPIGAQTTALTRPSPRLQGLHFALSSMEESARVGVMRLPDFFDIPLSQNNNGVPFAPGRPAESERFALRPIATWDADKLASLRPPWFVISEIWSEVGNQESDFEKARVHAYLTKHYDIVFAESSFPTRWRILFGPGTPPRDWMYPFYEQRIYQFRR